MDSLIVEVDGFTWNIDDRGDGPAVVMCHGFPGLGYSYRHQFAPLVDAGYRAVAPDMPGYGRTDRPREAEEYTNVAISNRLVRLLDVLGTMSGSSALERMSAFVPDLRGVHLLEGTGHFVQMERRNEVNDLLLRFLSGIRIPTRTAEQHFHRRSST
ncbi:alpha/beta fold hydrolase [Rhodococcus sp. D-6]|uniref:Alpha/beta fold hydrolase n=1 Tax=Rhodococcus sp. D-6 TaxID=1387842 RepID=A0AAU7UV67_9NOCA